MKIEATAKQIRALLALARFDRAQEEGSKAQTPGRDAVARPVPQALLDRYELLLATGRTPIVVPIERGACSGCHVRLATMIAATARRTPAIHSCPNCRRMLYAAEVTPDESDAGDRKAPGRPIEAGRRT